MPGRQRESGQKRSAVPAPESLQKKSTEMKYAKVKRADLFPAPWDEDDAEELERPDAEFPTIGEELKVRIAYSTQRWRGCQEGTEGQTGEEGGEEGGWRRRGDVTVRLAKCRRQEDGGSRPPETTFRGRSLWL